MAPHWRRAVSTISDHVLLHLSSKPSKLRSRFSEYLPKNDKNAEQIHADASLVQQKQSERNDLKFSLGGLPEIHTLSKKC